MLKESILACTKIFGLSKNSPVLKESILACMKIFGLSENGAMLKGSILACTKFFELSKNRPVLKGGPFELARKFLDGMLLRHSIMKFCLPRFDRSCLCFTQILG